MNHESLKVRVNAENLGLLSMTIFLGYSGINAVLTSLLRSSAVAHWVLLMLCYIPFAVVLIKKGVKYSQLIVSFAVGVSFLAYGIVNSSFLFESWALPAAVRFFSGIAGFYIISIQTNAERCYNLFKVIVLIIFLYNLVYSFSVEESASYKWGYDMGLGYRMMLAGIAAVYFFLDRRKIRLAERIFWIIIAFGALLVILSYGSRGPLLGFVAIVLVRFSTSFMLDHNISTIKKVLFIAFIVAAITVFYLYFTSILLFVSNLLEGQGISSRTLVQLAAGTISDSNGRAELWKKAMERINVLGWGPFADQAHFGEGSYCHNFFIEIYYDFGFILGTGVLLVLLYNFVRIIRYSQISGWYDMFAIYFCYCAARLSLSGTFWTETNFWVMIGLGTLCLEDGKRKKRSFAG